MSTSTTLRSFSVRTRPFRTHVSRPRYTSTTRPSHSELRADSTTRSTNSPPPPPRNHGIGRNTVLAISVLTALSAYTLGSLFPPSPLSLLFPRPGPPPPDDPNSEESKIYLENLEKKMLSLPLLQQMRCAPDAKEWYEARPYKYFDEDRRVNNLTAGALRGPGRLALPPLVRARWDEKESIFVIHVGRGLCGHDGIIHGGLLATLLDEMLARTAINNLPEKIGVTAKLSVNYRAPTKADQFIVVRTELIGVQGRRAEVKGRIEDLSGTLLVDATATFVQPRYAKLLNKAAIKQVMGAPPSDEHAPVVHLADGENLKALKGQDKQPDGTR
ncbi:Thioesterase/thiol ester dehydrase-isomerase [Marasmius fiardii PR-910]|nr:Thioesterase/thiol ester dehydrase-isomerase [Marasmius fiardii PR-910]